MTRHATDPSGEKTARVNVWSESLCEAADLPCGTDGASPEVDELLAHPNGEMSVAFTLVHSANGIPFEDRYVVRFAADGEVAWTRTLHSTPWDERHTEHRATAVAAATKSGLLATLYKGGDEPGFEVLTVDPTQESRTLFRARSKDPPRAVARWQSRIVIATNFDVALYEPNGELVWRQTALETAPLARTPSPYTLPPEHSEVELVPERDQVYVLRKESNYRSGLLKLSTEGNVLAYSHLELADVLPGNCRFRNGQWSPRDPMGGRVPRPNPSHPGAVNDWDTPDYERLMRRAMVVLDSSRRPVALQDNILTRFPTDMTVDRDVEAGLPPVLRVDAMERAAGVAVEKQAIDLVAGPDNRLYLLTRIRNEEEPGSRFVIDRLSADLSTHTVFRLPPARDGGAREYAHLTFGKDGTLYAYAEGSLHSASSLRDAHHAAIVALELGL